MFFEALSGIFTSIISSFGYFGVFLLMVLESMIFPVPSELVMPFAGFLISAGRFTFFGIFFVSSIASLFGSWISYLIGKNLGRDFLVKYGKYFLLSHHHLDLTDRFFAKFGSWAVFLSRFIPIIRHLISIPAGIAHMPLRRFLFHTFLGATIWNMFLVFLGFTLKEHWNVIQTYSHQLDIIMGVVLVCALGYFIYHQIQKRRSRKR